MVTNVLSLLALAALLALFAEKHINNRLPTKVARTTARMMVTTRPEVVRELSMSIHEIEASAVDVAQIMPEGHFPMPVEVVMQVEVPEVRQ